MVPSLNRNMIIVLDEKCLFLASISTVNFTQQDILISNKHTVFFKILYSLLKTVQTQISWLHTVFHQHDKSILIMKSAKECPEIRSCIPVRGIPSSKIAVSIIMCL